MSKHEKPAEEPAADESVAVELTESAASIEPPARPKATARQAKSTGIEWARVTAFRILPGLAVLLAAAAVFLWYLTSTHGDQGTRDEVVKVASDGSVTLLSYQPDKVRQQLTDATKLLTAPFKTEYANLTQTVIPGAEQKRITAVTVAQAAAPVSVSENHAVVLVFINQTVTVGDQPPTNTPTSVRVTLERLGGKWLIAKFETV